MQSNSLVSSSTDGEEYDSFDADVVVLGVVNLQVFTAEAHSSGARRVTSQRLISVGALLGSKPPRKQGIVQKYSPAIFKSWQSRHVDVNDGILKYFKVESGELHNAGTLNFDLYHCTVTISPKKPD